MVAGQWCCQLSVPGRPTNFDNIGARGYFCQWVLVVWIFVSLASHMFVSSETDGLIKTKILLHRAV